MNRFFFSPFRWLWIIIGVVVLAVVLTTLASVVSLLILGHPILMFGRAAPFFWFGPFFGFGWIIFGLLIVGFALRMVFRPWGRGMYYDGHRYYDPAMESLRERYARGEITKEQFDSMAGDLERHR